MRCLLVAMLTACFALAAHAQPCPTEPYTSILPLGLTSGDQYGASIAVDDLWLFVGAPGDDQAGLDAGAVYVFKMVSGTPLFHQKLLGAGGVGPGHFGFSVASEAGVLVIGADNDREITQSFPMAWGAAYVFVLQDDSWVQETKLFPFDAGNAQQFGYAVELTGQAIVVGARQVLNDGVSGKGAAYVFHFSITGWSPSQRLTSDAPSSLDAFGSSLAAQNGVIYVGASQNDDRAMNAGSVFVFSFNGNSWAQEQKLYAYDAASNDQFGSAIAVSGSTLVATARLDDSPEINAGAAYVFTSPSGHWIGGQKLVASDPWPNAEFGHSVALEDDLILIGTPNRDSQKGKSYLFESIDGTWVFKRAFKLSPNLNLNEYGPFECWQLQAQPPYWPENMDNARLGLAVAISDQGLFSSSALVRNYCWGYTGPADTGALYRFDHEWVVPDCNDNGVNDRCDNVVDCNGNIVPDICDLESLASSDCNSNQIPDECETDIRYQHDSGQGAFYWYTHYTSGNADFIWLNQFKVKPGGQFVTHVVLAQSGALPEATPIRVLLYVDPNDDGNPSDAVLVASETTSAVAHSDIQFVYVPINSTYVGEVGDCFFVGAVVQPFHLQSDEDPWAAPVTANWWPIEFRKSWRACAPPGKADIYNLQNNALPIQLWTLNSGSPFLVRALASDCNGNGAWDTCEIQAGEVVDDNDNGIPDTCEAFACILADIAPGAGDGTVNVVDLLYVISHWGVCNPCYAICPGDTTDDCTVNVADLLTVINAWGPCLR